MFLGRDVDYTAAKASDSPGERRWVDMDELGNDAQAASRLVAFYEGRLSERERLSRREGRLELARTRELLDRFLPPPPARVIDVGGGTGIHASWLAERGYSVHLVDIVPAHVEEASRSAAFSAAVGDARDLPHPDNDYDVALLLGPLYHLQAAEARAAVLREARRVVREGGMVVAAFISRGGVALDGHVKGWIDTPGAADSLKEQMREGFARADAGFGGISYFHLPSEARVELLATGLEVVAILGVEGPGWVAADFESRWADAAGREAILESARSCEAHPDLQALSPHLLAFCTVPIHESASR